MSLVTYQEAKTYMQLANDNDQLLVDQLISLVSAEVENYVNDTLDEVEVTGERLSFDQYRGSYDFEEGLLSNGQSEIQLFTKKTPIQLDSVTLFSKGVLVDPSNYRVESRYIAIYKYISDYKSDLTINYTAGYAVIPSDIQMVVLEGVKDAYQSSASATRGDSKVKSEKIGSYSVTYGDVSRLYARGVKQYIAGNKQLLDRYRLPVF